MRTTDRSKYGKIQELEPLEVFKASYTDNAGNVETAMVVRDSRGRVGVVDLPRTQGSPFLLASNWLAEELNAKAPRKVAEKEASE